VTGVGVGNQKLPSLVKFAFYRRSGVAQCADEDEVWQGEQLIGAVSHEKFLPD